MTGAAASEAHLQPARLVLDTNTVLDWLVFADTPALAIGEAIAQGRLSWLTTPRMLGELHAVLARPLPARWEPARELALTIDVVALAVVCAEPPPDGRCLVCRDAADQMFIDLARRHGPAVLLTRDRALLALRRRAVAFGVEITTAAAWWSRQEVPGGSAVRRGGPAGDRP